MVGFQSHIADAADVIDLQWIDESRDAGDIVMENFWKISKEILCRGHKGVQQQAWKGVGGVQNKIMMQLQAFCYRPVTFARSVVSSD